MSKPFVVITIFDVSQRRGFDKSLADARVMTISRPARRAISAALRCRTTAAPPPTVPSPKIPIFTGFIVIPKSIHLF